LPALIRKFDEAATQRLPAVVMWGSGKPRREFLHADDLADACFYLMQHFDESGFVNIGTGEDIEIKELAFLIKSITGYTGAIIHDLDKPDGTPRKLMDVGKLHKMGWKARIGLEEGIRRVYADYKNK
jgi:GDP-L-fucose synthase